MGEGEIWPPPPKNPLTDGHQNLCSLLRRGHLPPCKNLSKSVERFRFCACVISRPSAQSDSVTFLGTWERLQPRRAHRFGRKIRQTTRFRARHKRISWGAGGLQPPESGKIIFSGTRRRCCTSLHCCRQIQAEWLACWTQAQKGPGSNRSRDAIG